MERWKGRVTTEHPHHYQNTSKNTSNRPYASGIIFLAALQMLLLFLTYVLCLQVEWYRTKERSEEGEAGEGCTRLTASPERREG